MQSMRCHYLPLCQAGPTVVHAQHSHQGRKAAGRQPHSAGTQVLRRRLQKQVEAKQCVRCSQSRLKEKACVSRIR